MFSIPPRVAGINHEERVSNVWSLPRNGYGSFFTQITGSELNYARRDSFRHETFGYLFKKKLKLSALAWKLRKGLVVILFQVDFSQRRTCVHLRALFRTSHGVKVIRVQPCRPHFLPGGEPSEILENIFTASRSKDRQLRLAALVLRGLRLYGDLSRRVDSVVSVRTTPLIFQISYTKLDLCRLHHSDIPWNPWNDTFKQFSLWFGSLERSIFLCLRFRLYWWIYFIFYFCFRFYFIQFYFIRFYFIRFYVLRNAITRLWMCMDVTKLEKWN